MHKRYGGGILGTATAGSIIALWVILGKIGTRAITQFLRLDASNAGGAATAAGIQIGAGLGAAWLADMVMPGGDRGEYVFAGAVMGVGESFIRRLNIPGVSGLLGDEGDALMGYTYELSMYPENVNPAMALAAEQALPTDVPLGLYPGTEMGLYPAA